MDICYTCLDQYETDNTLRILIKGAPYSYRGKGLYSLHPKPSNKKKLEYFWFYNIKQPNHSDLMEKDVHLVPELPQV